MAGHETTATLIGNALWCFDEHPDARAEVAMRPELMATAVEEVLRFRSVVHWLPRVVKRDMQFLGQELKEGDLVLPVFAAANRDGDQFPIRIVSISAVHPIGIWGLATAFILCTRRASLARLEAKVALGETISPLSTDAARCVEDPDAKTQPIRVLLQPLSGEAGRVIRPARGNYRGAAWLAAPRS